MTLAGHGVIPLSLFLTAWHGMPPPREIMPYSSGGTDIDAGSRICPSQDGWPVVMLLFWSVFVINVCLILQQHTTFDTDIYLFHLLLLASFSSLLPKAFLHLVVFTFEIWISPK